MNDDASLRDVIARLETAPKGSRELDARLDAAIHGRDIVRVEGDSSLATLHTPGRYFYDAVNFSDAPNYTTSIDVALMLVPRGWSWRVGSLPSGHGFADLGTQKSLQCIQGSTPALALCIAALQARLSISSEDGPPASDGSRRSISATRRRAFT